MTIREQSKLNLFQYVMRITLPESISALVNSFEAAKDFFFNLMFVPILPIFVVAAAINRRKKDRELVAMNDKNREKKNAVL